MRYVENAAEVIERTKEKMKEVAKGLPEGVEFNIVYDRSKLINESITSIKRTLVEEMIVVSLVVLVFLFHWRSAVSIVCQIPITIAASFILLNPFVLTSTLLSLTAIAFATAVMLENG